MLHVTCYMLHVTCYMLQVTGYMLHVTCYMLHVTGYRLQVTGYRLQVTGTGIGCMFYLMKFSLINETLTVTSVFILASHKQKSWMAE